MGYGVRFLTVIFKLIGSGRCQKCENLNPKR